MKQVSWEDEHGRMFMSLLENHEPDSNAPRGILVGPPEIVDDLKLPDDVATRLHNQLFHRKLWTLQDVQKRPQELLAAWQAALAVSVQTLMTLYADYEKPDNQEV